VLNKNGFYWRPVAKKQPLSSEQLAARKAFVDKYGGYGPSWWERNIGLVFDGVTLTKAPKPLSGRAKHAALTVAQYRQRVAQLLNSYAVPVQGQTHSFLQRLVHGMPRRLAKCRANKYGPCGY